MKLSKTLIMFVALTLLCEGAFSYEHVNCTSNCTAPASTGQIIGFVAVAIGLVTLTFCGLNWVSERLARCDDANIIHEHFQTYGAQLNSAT